MNRISGFGIYAMVATQLNDFSESYKKQKEKLFVQWQDTYKLPRKAKKKARKRIILEHSINEWGHDMVNPFKF